MTNESRIVSNARVCVCLWSRPSGNAFEPLWRSRFNAQL